MIYLYVAFGGAIGAVVRFLLSQAMPAKYFPWATLTANITGAFVIGVIYVYAQNYSAQNWMKTFLMVGLLGGFTTFSAFSLETLHLFQSGFLVRGIGNIMASVGGCVLATAIGILCGRFLTG